MSWLSTTCPRVPGLLDLAAQMRRSFFYVTTSGCQFCKTRGPLDVDGVGWKKKQVSLGGLPGWQFIRFKIITPSIGYGSIPIHTIFSGMNIHLSAILMWTTGVQGFDTLPSEVEGYGELMEDWLQSRTTQINQEFLQRGTAILGSNFSEVVSRLRQIFRYDSLTKLCYWRCFPTTSLVEKLGSKVRVEVFYAYEILSSDESVYLCSRDAHTRLYKLVWLVGVNLRAGKSCVKALFPARTHHASKAWQMDVFIGSTSGRCWQLRQCGI